MIKLNDDSIFIGQIKQLLANFNLPNCEIGEQHPVHGKIFIDKGNIYKWKIDPKTGLPDKEIFDTYVLGKKYINLTANFKIQNMIYDRDTHRYLGKYLRFLRDYQNIDLMCMYNCFDAEMITQTLSGCKLTPSADSVIFSVPISGLSDLTILINSYVLTELCLYINNSDISNTDLELLTTNSLIKGKYNKSFIYPISRIIENKIVILDLIEKYRKDLRLLIKIPQNSSKNIVVLEGIFNSYVNKKQKLFNYHPTKIEGKKYITQGDTDINDLNIKEKSNNHIYSYSYVAGDKFLTSNLSKLLYIYDSSKSSASIDVIQSGYEINVQLLSPTSSCDQWLLSDRLIEYLSGNVITNLSSDYEIKNLQKCIDDYLRKLPPYKKSPTNIDRSKVPYIDYLNTSRYYGQWNPRDILNLRIFAYNNGLNIDKYDVLGYLDKDVENLIKSQLDTVFEKDIEGDFK